MSGLSEKSLPNPYDIRQSEDPYFSSFTTSRGVLYSCAFGKVPLLSPLLGVYDLEVRDFLLVLLYTCDSSDKKERARQKVFSQWHETIFAIKNSSGNAIAVTSPTM